MESLTKNYEFKRLYNKGRSAASKYAVVYCARNNIAANKLGITVSTKLGGAVQRNRIRRRLKEIYRLNELNFRKGYNIVIVARYGSRDAKLKDLESSLLYLFKKLGLNQSNDFATGSVVIEEQTKI
ncbi:MAG: ribonuclease P protein component [Oscillospiraceae bacterium]|nr:ribonuclease P protein component [Oscillospiraceae bacterium]